MNSGSCPLYDINALDDGHKAICSSKTLNVYKSMNTVESTSKGVNMGLVAEINLTTVLATAIYVQLKNALTVDVIDFNVAVSCDHDEIADELIIYDICGYIKTNRCGKETTLKFTIMDDGFGDIRITTIQDIDLNLPKQDGDGYVPPVCFVSRPNEPTVWVDFGERRVFYKWEDSLGMNINDLDAKLHENKLTFNAIAQDIIDTILAKVEPSA